MRYLVLLLSLSAHATTVSPSEFVARLETAKSLNNFPLFSRSGEPCSLDYGAIGNFLELKIVRPHHSIRRTVYMRDTLELQDDKLTFGGEEYLRKGGKALAWTFTFDQNQLSSVEAAPVQCTADDGRTCTAVAKAGRAYACTTTPFGP